MTGYYYLQSKSSKDMFAKFSSHLNEYLIRRILIEVNDGAQEVVTFDWRQVPRHVIGPHKLRARR